MSRLTALWLAGLLVGGTPALAQTEIAESPEMMWNGVTVSKKGRIFAAFPRMEGTPTISVGELLPDGSIKAYPGGEWNAANTSTPHAQRFVGVNAVVSDAQDQLWVVDPAGGFGSVPQVGAAKLVQIDIASNAVKRVYPISTDVLPEKGFINDVRVGDGYAYLTDSGLGALIVVELSSGKTRRVLANDARLKADPSLKLSVDGKPYLNAKRETPQMHVNPLDISPDGNYLYFQPSAGPRLWRLPVAKLQDFSLDDAALGAAIEDTGPTRFNAGITIGPDWSIYYSDLEKGGITRRTPDGKFETVAADPSRIVWPDASRIGPDGALYFPAAQINRLPANNPEGKNRIERPFRMFKTDLPK